MFKKITLATLSFVAISSSNSLCYAEEDMDVDQADSLDFESFHKPKDSAIKVYDSESGEYFTRKRTAATKIYDEHNSTAVIEKKSGTKKESIQTSQRFEIRQRYTIGISDQTSDSAATAVNALHKKMASHCPNGWEKQKEWSLAVNKDYYLHYAFKCIQ